MTTTNPIVTAAEARERLAGREIWLWHYMHSDWQWEQSRHWHEERYALAVCEALDLMQRDPEFCYFFDNTSEFYGAVAQRLGSRLPELEQRVAEGRVRLMSGQVANCRPTQVGDETYIRNIQLGLEYFRTHLPPTDLSLFHSVDIAIGGVQMPQVLTQLGFQYYRAWRPHGPMNALGIPQQFHWQGIDGSRILVTRGSYGGWLGDAPINDPAADWDSKVAWLYDTFFHDQIVRERSCSDHLWMIQGADDARPLRNWLADKPEDVQRFVATWREREAAPIHWCTPLEFSRAVAAQADRLPVVEGVLDGADCGYNMANHGSHGLWMWRQMNDRRLLEAEWWAAHAQTVAGYTPPVAELKRLWYQHCTYQAHAQDHGFEADWDFLVDRARDVKYQAARITEDALGAIVTAAGGGTRTTRYIFNPLPWPVEADVAVYHACVAAGVELLTAVDEQGAALDQQPLREFRHSRFGGSINDEYRLVRITLPPAGFRRIELVESAAKPAAQPAQPAPEVVETGSLRLVYRDHALREVHDLAGGQIYAAREGSPWPGLFYHLLDHQDWISAGPELRRERFVPQSSEWLEAGPLRWRHRSIGALGPYAAWLDTTVSDRGRELQVAVRLEGHWDTPPVTGFATLLADVKAGGRMTVDTPFAVEDRDPDHDVYVGDIRPDREHMGITDQIERLRPGVFWGRSWADWSGVPDTSRQGQGLTMISTDGCYYWFKEPNQFGHVLLRGVELKEGTWEAFCPASLTGAGTHTFHYALRFHDGDWRQADPQRRSLELHYPPLVVRADHPTEATLPAGSVSLLAVEGPALLSAYYAESDANILRLYEHTGQGGDVIVKLDRAPASAQAVELSGQPADTPVIVEGREVRLHLRPWQIATVRLAA